VFLLLDSWACVLQWAMLLFGGSDSPNIPVTPVRGAEATAVNKFGGRRRPQVFLLLCLKIPLEGLVVQKTSLVILQVGSDLGLAERLQMPL